MRRNFRKICSLNVIRKKPLLLWMIVILLSEFFGFFLCVGRDLRERDNG